MQDEIQKNSLIYTVDSLNQLTPEERQKAVSINIQMAEFMGYSVTYFSVITAPGANILNVPGVKNSSPSHSYMRYDESPRKDGGFEPVYTKIPVPKDIFLVKEANDKQIEPFLEKHEITYWNPAQSIEDTIRCEEKLMQLGKYNNILVDLNWSSHGFMGAGYPAPDFVQVTYYGSMYNKDLIEQGVDRWDAIRNACLKFNKEQYKR